MGSGNRLKVAVSDSATVDELVLPIKKGFTTRIKLFSIMIVSSTPSLLYSVTFLLRFLRLVHNTFHAKIYTVCKLHSLCF